MNLGGVVGLKNGVHRDLPQPRKLELTPADVALEAVVGDALVKSIGPERIGAADVGSSGGSHRGIVGEACLVQLRQRVAAEVEERSAESSDGRKGDAGERVEGFEVAEDLRGVRRSDVRLIDRG